MDKMLQEITWKQFMEWEFYSEMDPFEEKRSDWRTASIVAAIVNMNRDTKKYPFPLPVADFLLDFKPKKEQTWEEKKQIAIQIASLYNA